jgi:aryl-alcohol dehydrogenase-like predicted oxidoreductase
MSEGPNGTGASRRRIRRAVEESLRRLQTDHIDLYQVHAQDLDTPEEETLRALDDLVHAGKVLYLGASNYTGYRLVDSLWLSRARGLNAFVTLQAHYSLIGRDLERELVPACRQFGLGILPYSPLAGGLLSGKYRRGQEPPPGTRFDKWKAGLARIDERGWRILDALEELARARAATVGRVALAWVLQRPQVTSVIFGARSAAQLDDNLAAAELRLSADEVKRLDEASAFDPGYPYDFLARIQGRW